MISKKSIPVHENILNGCQSSEQAINFHEVSYGLAVDLWINGEAEVFRLYDDGTEAVCDDGFKRMVDHFDNGGRFGIEKTDPQLIKMLTS